MKSHIARHLQAVGNLYPHAVVLHIPAFPMLSALYCAKTWPQAWKTHHHGKVCDRLRHTISLDHGVVITGSATHTPNRTERASDSPLFRCTWAKKRILERLGAVHGAMYCRQSTARRDSSLPCPPFLLFLSPFTCFRKKETPKKT